MNASQTKTIEEIAAIREAQLADYRKQQEELNKPFRVDKSPVTVVPVNAQLVTIRKLLDDCSAINVPLMLGSNGNAAATISSELDYKLNQLYQAIKDVREVAKYSGKLIS
jgi:hypothetical protein